MIRQKNKTKRNILSRNKLLELDCGYKRMPSSEGQPFNHQLYFGTEEPLVKGIAINFDGMPVVTTVSPRIRRGS